jgi:hypothetical protein
VALSAHTPDQGTGWSSTYLRIVAANDNVDWDGNAAAADPICGRENTDVRSDEMIVSAVVSPGANFASRFGGVLGRCNATDADGRANHYRIDWDGTKVLELFKRISNSNTSLGSYTDAGNRDGRTVKLELLTAAKKAYLDGTERISSTDESLIGNSFAGIHVSETTEPFVDDYEVVDVQSAAPEQLIRSGEV